MLPTTIPSSVRKGAAVVGVAGMLALAGCASDGTDTSSDAPAETPDTSTSSETETSTTTGAAYTDGEYTAEGTYQTPDGAAEEIAVTITLADGAVTAVEVTGDPQAPQSKQYQSEFIAGIADEVVGTSLDEIAVDKVAGSSLTSGGFNQAIEDIKQQAAA